MKNEKQRNQNGELTSDKPEKELISPGKRENRYKSRNKERDKNSTGKDPNLGSRHITR